MKNKGIEEIIKGYNCMSIDISDLELQIEEVEAVCGVKGIDYSRDKVTSSNVSSETENIALRLVLLKERLLHLQSLQRRINNALDKMDTELAEILRLTYIQNKPYINVACKLCISVATYYRKLDKALEELDRILFKNE